MLCGTAAFVDRSTGSALSRSQPVFGSRIRPSLPSRHSSMGLTACRRPGGGEVLASRAHLWSFGASLGSGSSWWGFSSGRLEVALCIWCRSPLKYRPSPSLPARQVDIWFELRLTLSSLGRVALCQPRPSVQSAYLGRSERAAPSFLHTSRTQVRWSVRLVQPSTFHIGLSSLSSPR